MSPAQPSRPVPRTVPRTAPRPALGAVGPDRRQLLAGATAVLGLAGLAGAARAEPSPPGKPAKPAGQKSAEEDEPDIGPGEDLMREHGVLRRVLLVYGETCRGLDAGARVDVGAIQRCAKLIRSFVEDYHERQEEQFVFPRFERAGKLVELVRILRAQHQAGRKTTDQVVGLATASTLADPVRRRELRDRLLAFVRMYEPHAAREDTVLFPALHGLVSPHEYDALGEDFERREHQIFGGDGFERAVAEVDAIERSLGIEDLSLFTPRT